VGKWEEGEEEKGCKNHFLPVIFLLAGEGVKVPEWNWSC
jgi:hypothetical protein